MASTSTSTSLSAPSFELESWVSNYEGPLLLRRLAHIALHCPSLSRQAFILALDAAKRGKEVIVFRQLADLNNSQGHAIDIDQEWAARQDEANKRELVRLEGELKGYKNNLIRESIRMGQEDLATHLFLSGGPQQPPISEPAAQTATTHNQYGLAAAYHAFGKMREFCTTPTHVAGMTLRLLFTALAQAITALQTGGSAIGHFGTVNAQANRLRSVGVKEEEQAQLAPISAAASGIACLGLSQYRDAAKHFLAVSFDPNNRGPVQGFDFYRSVAAANDIAVYGGLTALATLSRDDLNTKLLGGPFRAFLELEPHVRKAVTLYTTGKYRACLETLQHYYSDWSLDIFLGAGIDSPKGSHVDRLFARIRERSITAYCSSFSLVSLSALASTFPPTQSVSDASTTDAIEAELIPLIESGALKGRLDLVNGTLLSPSADKRSNTHQAAIEAAEEIERTLLERLHRINVSMAHLEITRPKSQGFASTWPERMRS